MVYCLVLMLAPDTSRAAQEHTPRQLAIVVSLKIKPYMDTLTGIESYLESVSNIRWEVFFLPSESPSDDSLLVKQLKKQDADVILSVGPEAMQLIWGAFQEADSPIKLFSMVMKPQRIVLEDAVCGIPLDIPADVQLDAFRRLAPFLDRIGLIYNPKNNATFAADASIAAARRNIDLVHLKVRSRDDILPVFRRHLSRINALWMIPDATIVSESLIPFLIKQAIANNVAVFGYNRYFHENGALLSLVRDYTAIGRHLARMAISATDEHICRQELPDFQVQFNADIFNRLGYDDALIPSQQNTEAR